MDETQVLAIAREALRLPPEARASFLDSTCDSDALRREVEALLSADAEASAEGFLDDPLRALRSVDASPSAGTFDEDDDLIGRTVGPYVIEREAGIGGMGVVYAARDLRLGRRVAVKVLPSTKRTDPDAKARFIREARAASALDHANICTIFEIGEMEDGRLYTAMAYYEGQNLAEHLADGPLAIDEVRDVLRQAAQGLSCAHQAGITHRDVKPSNIMLVDGIVKILDFGVVKLEGENDLTADGRLIGTVSYMAPEQARSDPVDERTDIWALGVLGYEMLTGEHPFRRATPVATLHALQFEEPKALRSLRPDVPPALARIVHRMLAKAPGDRYALMQEVIDDLDRAFPSEARLAFSLGVRRATPWLLLGVGIVSVLLLALLVPSRFRSDAPEVHSIAVLPLVNHSVDPTLAPFAESMTDALIADLGQIEDLRVISRTSARAYRDTDKSLPEIAEELEVTTIVEGGVQASDGQVGITVQLVDAAADRVLWAQSYTRPLRDVVSLQHEVALAIASEIEASISPQAEVHFSAAPAVNPEAYRHYLWGVYHRNLESPDSWREAAQRLEQSIAIDSTFAAAHAVLARVLVLIPDRTQDERARRAAERALALDPTLSAAHVSLGLYHEMSQWNWAAAERDFRRAIQQTPSDAEAHHELGLLLMRQRRFDEALPVVQQALYLDPLSTRFLNGVAAVHLFSGRYEQALELLQQSLAVEESNPVTYWRLGMVYQALGRHEEAVAAFRRLVDVGGLQTVGHLGHALAVAGQRAEAQSFLDSLLIRKRDETSPGGNWLSYNIAVVYAGLGDKEAALTWLERAVEERALLLAYLNVVPSFAGLRDHPRFQALLRRISFDNRSVEAVRRGT